MTRVKYTADGGHYRVAGHAFDPGDTRDVPDDLADYLVDEVGEFTHAEATDVDYREVEADDSDDEGEENTLLDVDAGETTADEWADWNEDDWFDLDWKQREEDVREGRVDDHLEEIADAETSANVQEAAEERQIELEE